MATLRNKRKLAAVTRETQEEHPRNGQSRNTSVPRINEDYITQVSEEIECRVTRRLSQEFNRTESRILGALSKLDEFLLNPQITTHSGTVPGTFRNTNVENQGTNEDDSQSDPHPEAGIFRGQTTQFSGPKDCRDSISCLPPDDPNGWCEVVRTVHMPHEQWRWNHQHFLTAPNEPWNMQRGFTFSIFKQSGDPVSILCYSFCLQFFFTFLHHEFFYFRRNLKKTSLSLTVLLSQVVFMENVSVLPERPTDFPLLTNFSESILQIGLKTILTILGRMKTTSFFSSQVRVDYHTQTWQSCYVMAWTWFFILTMTQSWLFEVCHKTWYDHNMVFMEVTMIMPWLSWHYYSLIWTQFILSTLLICTELEVP